MLKIYPSLIASDLLTLGATIKELDPICAGYHLDIMDNHFVPNLTWGPQFINAIDAATSHPSWIHFMIDNPETLIGKLTAKAGSIATIHAEHLIKKNNIIADIRENKWRPSIALSPKMPVETIFPFLDLGIDHVLIMSVEPGFSGQEFIPDAISKLKSLIDYRDRHGLALTIAMDGGINEKNIHELVKSGLDTAAVATGIFGQKEYKKALMKLTELAK